MSNPKCTDDFRVYLPDGYGARLEKMAQADHRKLAQMARVILVKAVDQWEIDNRQPETPKAEVAA
jgi:hypothetical protein